MTMMIKLSLYISVRLPPSVVGSPLDGDDLLKYFETEETMRLQCKATGVPEPE